MSARIAYIIIQDASNKDVLLQHADMVQIFNSIPGQFSIGKIDTQRLKNLSKILAQAKNIVEEELMI